MSKEESIKLMNEIKHVKINVRKTIENAYNSDYLSDIIDTEYNVEKVTPGNFCPDNVYDMIESLSITEEYYDKVNELLDESGIYITLAYVYSVDGDTGNPNKVEFMDDDINLNEIIEDYGSLEEAESFIEIASVNENILFKSFEWNEIRPDAATSYGIKVQKSDDEFTIEVGYMGGGMHAIPPKFSKFRDDRDKFSVFDINCPVCQIITKLICDSIVIDD